MLGYIVVGKIKNVKPGCANNKMYPFFSDIGLVDVHLFFFNGIICFPFLRWTGRKGHRGETEMYSEALCWYPYW